MAQLKSTNITGNLAVTGNVVANKLIKLGGTSDQILMADGTTSRKSEILGKINAAVTIQGTLGSGGTITALPTASSSTLGDGYKVITAGTYNNVSAKIGDMFICYQVSSSSYAWMHIPSGDDIEDTWRPIQLNGTQILSNGNTSNALNFKPGSNIGITNSSGTLTFTATDTGATAITTSGSGNAVTEASYNASNRTITLTKGSTFALASDIPTVSGFVTGPGASTDNAIARYDGTTGKIVQNSSAKIDDNGIVWANGFGDGTITIKPHASNEINFGGTNTGTTIYFGHQATDSRPKPTSYVFGGVDADASVRANRFIKTSSNDNYVLLGGGGHKALSEFQGSGNYVTLDTAQTITGIKTFSTHIKTAENTMGIKLRTHDNYETGWVYGTSGNEAITLAMQNPVTAFQIVYGTKPSAYGAGTWQTVTPLFQTKDGKVIINRKIAETANTTSLKLLDVNGEMAATTIYENGTSLANKYLGKTAKAADSDKLDGYDSSHYLNYNNLTNKPTISTVNNGTLTMNTSGTGLSGSASFTANQSGNSTFTVALNSSSAGNRSANQVVLATAAGQINSTKYTITSGATAKATWQYNSTTDCVELVWA